MLKKAKTIHKDYLIKQLPTAIAFVDNSFIISNASDQWLNLFTISNTNFSDCIFTLLGPSSEPWRTNMLTAFNGKILEQNNVLYTDCSGKILWLNLQFHPWFNEDENIVGTIIKAEKIVKKITSFKTVTRPTKPKKVTTFNDDPNSGRLLKTIIDNLPVNVFVKDLKLRKILVNKAECEYLGIQDTTEILGKTDFDLYDKEVAEISKQEDDEVIKTLTPILGRETSNTTKEGKTTTFLTSKIPMMDDEGDVNGIVGISLDISALKQKEDELRGLINVTSLQNKKLINFAHIISHNLRSHAANFSMLLDFLKHETCPNEKKNLTNMLVEASDKLLDSLENLNEVVDINLSPNLNKQKTNLLNAVKNVEEHLKDYILNHNAKITTEINDSVTLNAVPAYLENILMNFITNGIKYRHPARNPSIAITARKENTKIIMEISDNGLGIDLKLHGDKLFGMYKTFHENKEARGIGLYITKNQIEAMNGYIEVESEVGKGTKFKIIFNG